MAKTRVYNTMQKRGQVGEIIGAIILIGVLVLGGVGSYKIISENRYVGDPNTKIVYDLKFCDIKNVLDEKPLSFSNLEEAYKAGYKDAECNR